MSIAPLGPVILKAEKFNFILWLLLARPLSSL